MGDIKALSNNVGVVVESSSQQSSDDDKSENIFDQVAKSNANSTASQERSKPLVDRASVSGVQIAKALKETLQKVISAASRAFTLVKTIGFTLTTSSSPDNNLSIGVFGKSISSADEEAVENRRKEIVGVAEKVHSALTSDRGVNFAEIFAEIKELMCSLPFIEMERALALKQVLLRLAENERKMNYVNAIATLAQKLECGPAFIFAIKGICWTSPKERSSQNDKKFIESFNAFTSAVENRCKYLMIKEEVLSIWSSKDKNKYANEEEKKIAILQLMNEHRLSANQKQVIWQRVLGRVLGITQ
jgi:hypothetical protein